MAKRKSKVKEYFYELPSKEKVAKLLRQYPKRVLACDPGYRNFGIAVVGANPETGKVTVLANAVLMHPINSFPELHDQYDVFMEEIASWVELFQPHGIIAERFQIRGSSSAGTSCELVSFMMGAMRTKYDHLPFKAVPAVQWKVPVQRRFEIDLKETYKQTLVAAHQLDACLIGCYGLEAGLEKELNYDPEAIYLRAEDCSLVPLVNRKNFKR